MLKNTPPHPIESVLLAPLTEEVVKRLQALRLMAFDVDGVLTDGLLWYGDQGEIAKSFHVHDGHGLRLLKESGLHVVLIPAVKALLWRAGAPSWACSTSCKAYATKARPWLNSVRVWALIPNRQASWATISLTCLPCSGPALLPVSRA